MNKIILLLGIIFLATGVFSIDPDINFVQPNLMDSNTMGIMLVQEWAFGSIDLAFLIFSMIIVFILLKYGIPISMIMVSVMGVATVFAFGFSSIFAWGILLAGIVAISLMIVVNLLLKTQY